jgi:phosphopantetheine--protein transferase-like protein
LEKITVSTLVYYAIIPESLEVVPVYPKLRSDEIFSAKSEKARREKFAVWKLLEYALTRQLGKEMEFFTFSKTASGKWQADGVEFSLSHSGRLVAVALSDSPVGVDVEKITPRAVSVAEKVLSKEEFASYALLSDREKTEFFVQKWTEKESLFKRSGENAFFESKICEGDTLSRKIETDGEEYFLTVAVETGKTVEFLQGEL